MIDPSTINPSTLPFVPLEQRAALPQQVVQDGAPADPTTTPERDDYLSKAGLKSEFGLTDRLIARLGPPDRTVPNPHYRKAAPMQLYARTRVAAWVAEHGDEVDAAGRRSQARREVAARQARALVAAAEQTPIAVEVLDPAKLRTRALASYNALQEDRAFERGEYWWEPAGPDADPAFLERLEVNFIRHHLTRYDHELEKRAGKVGVHDAVQVIRRRVYDAIAALYPQYADECRRQWRRRREEETR